MIGPAAPFPLFSEWPGGRMVEVEPVMPPPVITSIQTFMEGWHWWPKPVTGLEIKAQRAGWQVRTGFARGYKPGRTKGTFELLDTITVWLAKPDRPVMGFTWERAPDAANEWKAAKATIRGSNGTVVKGHTEAKLMLGVA